MKQTTQSADMTSFHGHQIEASPFELEILFENKPWTDSGDGKVSMRWTMENEAGEVFTVYDWKEYRKIGLHESIIWNIGGHSHGATDTAKLEALQCLKYIRHEWIHIQ